MSKLLRKAKAWINRTFVADCPVCHKHFYGKHGYSVQVKINNKIYRIVCSQCAQTYNNEKSALNT